MKISNRILCCIFLYAATLATSAEITIREGFAYDMDSDRLLYTEVHHEYWAENILVRDRVEYRLPDGEILAEKLVEYGDVSSIPDFELRNRISGHLESARKIDNQFEVNFQRNRRASKRSAKVDIPPDSVSDAGFDRMIEAHWPELIMGERIKRQFLIPSMMRFITFRVYQDAVISAKEKQFRRIIIEPDNPLLRFVADRIVVDYSFDEPVLRRFSGVSNMRDEDGKNYRASIFFPDEHIKLALLREYL